MESVDKDKAALISGIEKDARAEEERILKEAETKAAEKKKYSEKKIDSILDEARAKAREQAELAKKGITSTAEREVKRRSMRLRDVLMQEIMGRVERKLASMTGDKQYKSVLADWLVEAAIGLEAPSAVVNASREELKLIDGKMLSEVARRVRKEAGEQVELKLSNEQPLTSQGVVLTAADGRTAFNNQVRTRMQRSKREIQMLVYDTLFADNKKE